MPDTKVIDEIPVVVLNPLDTFYVAAWNGAAFEDRNVTFGDMVVSIGNSLTVKELHEVPTGSIDGVNAIFQLSQTPVGNSLAVYKNGLLQLISAGGDLTVAAKTITFVPAAIPLPGDKLTAIYNY